jgi:hypothetical protein
MKIYRYKYTVHLCEKYIDMNERTEPTGVTFTVCGQETTASYR